MARRPGWDHGLSAEARWVLGHGTAARLAAPSAVLDPARWDRLRLEAGAHRLSGLLVDAVATGALAVTAEQADQVAQLELDLTRVRMWQEQQVVAVIDALAQAGVATRVLKGLALATLDYPDPQMRPTGDIDLLVHGADLDRAGAHLLAAGAERIDPDPRPGYSATLGKGATYRTDTGEVDLHRLLVWGPLGVRLDPERLWEQARPFELAGYPLATLGHHDMLLHTCCHLLVLGSRRAVHLRDVAQLVSRPDLGIEALLVRARQWGAEAVLATALVLTAEELALPLDPGLERWARGYSPTWRDRLWLRVERPDQPLAGLEAAATMVELDGAGPRLDLVRATLAPAPGTWPSPTQRATVLARRLGARRRGTRAPTGR